MSMSITLHPTQPIYLVDDESAARESMEILLRSAGLGNTVPMADPREMMAALERQRASVVLLDLGMPHVSGESLLQRIASDYPDIPIIVVTGTDTVDTAVFCMRHGAFDYLVKPLDAERLLSSVRRALERQLLEEENRRVREKLLSPVLDHPEHFAHIVTCSPALAAIFQYVEAIASLSHPVLITGETGVGKELVARAIHTASGRQGDLVSVNVAGLDDTMFSDTLFGHVKGAFTSADKARNGLILTAQGGTLVLDEIGDLSIQSQVKLLRVLQEGEFLAAGSDVPRKTDARIIATTNADLGELQAAGKFRKDLYYRLSANRICVPPLRQRREDIPLLANHFLAEFAKEQNIPKPVMPAAFLSMLEAHDLAGNVRELRSMMLDAVTRKKMGKPAFQAADDAAGTARAEPDGTSADRIVFPSALPTPRQVVEDLVAEAMRRADGKQSAAARLLGISQQAIAKRLKRTKGADDPDSE